MHKFISPFTLHDTRLLIGVLGFDILHTPRPEINSFRPLRNLFQKKQHCLSSISSASWLAHSGQSVRIARVMPLCDSYLNRFLIWLIIYFVKWTSLRALQWIFQILCRYVTDKMQFVLKNIFDKFKDFEVSNFSTSAHIRWWLTTHSL